MGKLYSDLLDQLQTNLKPIDQVKELRAELLISNIQLCQSLIAEVRERYLTENLTLQDQITFFKTIKPPFYAELGFQREVLNYLQAKPEGPKQSIKSYINEHFERSSATIAQYLELSRYHELQSQHLDELYYTNRPYDPRLHSNLEIPIDPDFSSPADPTLSKLQALKQFQQFLKGQQYNLNNTRLGPTWEPTSDITWTRSKIDLVELLYAVHATRAVNVDIKELADSFQQFFKVDLGKYYRTYVDIKLKKNPTSYIDALKTDLIEKIREENEK